MSFTIDRLLLRSINLCANSSRLEGKIIFAEQMIVDGVRPSTLTLMTLLYEILPKLFARMQHALFYAFFDFGERKFHSQLRRVNGRINIFKIVNGL